MKNKKGITLIPALIGIAIFIIALFFIVFFLNKTSTDSKEATLQRNFATLKSAVNKINSQYDGTNAITSISSEFRGTTIDKALDIHTNHSLYWYVLSEDDLKFFGIKDAENTFVVNYKDNIVMTLEEFLSSEYGETKQGLSAILNAITEISQDSNKNQLPGQSAEEVLNISNDKIKNWFILYNDDLKKLGILPNEESDEGYAVNYEEKLVMTLDNFLKSEDAISDISSNAIISLIKEGTIKLGDYISYVPDESKYTTLPSETGLNNSETFSTEKNLDWRIIYVDTIRNEVFITPSKVINTNAISFKSMIGYLNAPKVLNDLCASLYSNQALKLTARSMTVEDLDKICKYHNASESTTRIAYHPFGSSKLENVTYHNDVYESKTTSNKSHKFLSADGGGKVNTETYNGYEYSYHTPDAILGPVYMTNTYYQYNIEDYLSEMTYVLNQYYSTCFLANSCVKLDDDKANYCIRTFGENTISATIDRPLYESDGRYATVSSNYRPVVILSSNIILEESDNGQNGATPETAWKIKLR